jgi:FKBP-type peptidyl-prolyl cis-trans isomerase SlyD
MKIENNTVAIMAYKITIDDKNGDLIESADEQHPKSMLFGLNKMIPGFESKLLGHQPGDSFEFDLTAAEAFGDYRSEMVIDVPKTAFVVDGKLRDDLLFIENEIGMMDSQGNPIRGRIVELHDEHVKMDFNHQLAGKKLFVSGTIQDVRQVTAEDLNPSGGCGCGSGGGGCGSHDESSSCCSSGSENAYEEDCPTCGNPAEERGKGSGNCGCG